MTARGRSYNTYDDFRDGSYHPIITSNLKLTRFSHYKIPENGSNEPNLSRSPSPSVNQYSGYSQYSCMTPTSQLSASRTQASLTPTISRTPTLRTPTSRTPTSMTPSYSVTPTYASITPSYNSDNDKIFPGVAALKRENGVFQNMWKEEKEEIEEKEWK